MGMKIEVLIELLNFSQICQHFAKFYDMLATLATFGQKIDFQDGKTHTWRQMKECLKFCDIWRKK